MSESIVVCQSCGQRYDINFHNWCPNCRVVHIKNQNQKNFFMEDDSWETKIDTITECSKSPKEIVVNIEPIVKNKIEYLMEKFKNTEWLAYLIGDKNIGNKVVDIFIPNQVVNSVNVKDIKCDEYNNLNVIGVIHSHHNMGNNFSHTDDEWINQNHNISLCISKSGINGHVRWKSPCGAFKIVKAKVVLNLNFDFNTKEFDKIIETKIKKETFNRMNFGFGQNNCISRQYGSYHFTKNPVIKKKVNTNDKDHVNEDHVDEDYVEIISKNVYGEILKSIECDMN